MAVVWYLVFFELQFELWAVVARARARLGLVLVEYGSGSSSSSMIRAMVMERIWRMIGAIKQQEPKEREARIGTM